LKFDTQAESTKSKNYLRGAALSVEHRAINRLNRRFKIYGQIFCFPANSGCKGFFACAQHALSYFNTGLSIRHVRPHSF